MRAKTTLGEGFPAFGVYGASKAAVRSFARTWTVDLKARNIRVNTLSQGTINTNILAGVPQDAMDNFNALVPRGKIGEPKRSRRSPSSLRRAIPASSPASSCSSIGRRADLNSLLKTSYILASDRCDLADGSAGRGRGLGQV